VRVFVVGESVSVFRMLESVAVAVPHPLELLGFAKDEAPSGMEPSPDVVLIDVADEERVVTLLRRIREDYPSCEVLLITPHDRGDWLRRVSAMGASFCLMRPFEVQNLVKRLVQVARPAARQTEARLSQRRRLAYEKEAAKILTDLGVPAHFKGFGYLKTAVALAVEDRSFLHSITSRLYPQVADVYGVTPVHVERSMRHAIEVTWMRGNMDLIHYLFAYSIHQDKGKPTNGLFIARLADHLRLHGAASSHSHGSPY